MGEEMGSMSDCIFLDSKITADGDCSHKIKRCLLLGRKAITNLDSILKSRDITLLTKVCIVKTMFFPLVMYRCESWTINKSEKWKTDALICGAGENSWESLGLQGDETSQSWRKASVLHWKDWCWRWSSNTLATWCQEPTHWKRPWCWGRLKVGGWGDNRGWDGCMASPTQWTWVWANSGRKWRIEKPGMLQSIGSQGVRCDLATEQQHKENLIGQIKLQPQNIQIKWYENTNQTVAKYSRSNPLFFKTIKLLI